ncbi:hypothetical protein E2C01_015683 [Portunus trituberculatus]|uniref:Uncharacterized protein n=1 Tax=Portunus trituberculatus TaxID=210409 RepID=A0A5B7DM73_PORTR|nr:hypothetical protein [Portunus trituberculatus]
MEGNTCAPLELFVRSKDRASMTATKLTTSKPQGPRLLPSKVDLSCWDKYSLCPLLERAYEVLQVSVSQPPLGMV